ncbi:hypothetical protein FM037_11275 [Shewanella psychropiezotolerans]|uniref:Orphan protein n=1 Tax=Shewanella psychropiezotolerans TaxID=2593655 RepID=A0ABX5WX97_9GAMM|nr:MULTISPECIES: hypothetical protein [Shewanella]MPY26687.1 hypothetical protein [Shewanella sp. YLB-07]QDO83711.1 hypothetical protein FM037_11275 [Shewanella psychropiezotolerans]
MRKHSITFIDLDTHKEFIEVTTPKTVKNNHLPQRKNHWIPAQKIYQNGKSIDQNKINKDKNVTHLY